MLFIAESSDIQVSSKCERFSAIAFSEMKEKERDFDGTQGVLLNQHNGLSVRGTAESGEDSSNPRAGSLHVEKASLSRSQLFRQQ